MHAQNGILVSGDEAGRLTAWRPEADKETDVEMADASSDIARGGGGIKRGREDDQQDVRIRHDFSYLFCLIAHDKFRAINGEGFTVEVVFASLRFIPGHRMLDLFASLHKQKYMGCH